MSEYYAEYWAEIRKETEDRKRRFAARVEEQRLLHEADPEHHSLMVPVDDEEFGTEAYTAGWQQEEDA